MNFGRKTKIVATLGPATDTPEKIEELYKIGLNVARLNMSHGTAEEITKKFEMVREVSEKIAILLDISGPKIRLGPMEKPVELRKGDDFTLTSEDVVGNEKRAGLSYPQLVKETSPGNTLFINDGLVQLSVVSTTETEIKCVVEYGGPISSRKGVNTHGIPIKLVVPTEKDKKDILGTCKLEPDYYAVSFVRKADDLKAVQDLILTEVNEEVPLISKIEHQDALINLTTILRESAGIMIARGDLGVEIPPEQVPLLQKDLIRSCNVLGKPVIVATQMLESMTFSPAPTRAEVSDVANAIIDGCDAVMLSAETASGKYPNEAVGILDRIAREVESHFAKPQLERLTDADCPPIYEAIGRSAVSLAYNLRVDAIIATTRSGKSCEMVSKFRPNTPILGFTPNIQTLRRLQLNWGVCPSSLKYIPNTDRMINSAIIKAVEDELISDDAVVVIVAGTTLGLPSPTNYIQVLNVAEIMKNERAKKDFDKIFSMYR